MGTHHVYDPERFTSTAYHRAAAMIRQGTTSLTDNSMDALCHRALTVTLDGKRVAYPDGFDLAAAHSNMYGALRHLLDHDPAPIDDVVGALYALDHAAEDTYQSRRDAEEMWRAAAADHTNKGRDNGQYEREDRYDDYSRSTHGSPSA